MGINFFSISVYVPLKMWYYGIAVKIGLIFIHKGNSLVFFRVKNMKGEWNEKRKKCSWLISSCKHWRSSTWGFSLPEQKERLEQFCKFKGYEIVDYYEGAGISAKTGNLRPEFERLKEDIKSKKISTIVALKLDRIDCANDEINTTNGKIFINMPSPNKKSQIDSMWNLFNNHHFDLLFY